MPDSTSTEQPRLTVPKGWTKPIQAAMLQVIALAQFALSYTRCFAANCPNERVRLAAKADQHEQQVALLREEIRIKDARFTRIPAARRPHYQPTERLAILELRAARCWSQEQTAKFFQVTATNDYGITVYHADIYVKRELARPLPPQARSLVTVAPSLAASSDYYSEENTFVVENSFGEGASTLRTFCCGLKIFPRTR